MTLSPSPSNGDFAKQQEQLRVEQCTKTEQAFRENEQLYRTIFDNTYDGFALVEPIFDKDGKSDDYRVISVNKAWVQQTGVEQAAIEGKRIKEVMPNLEPTWATRYANIVTSKESQRFEECNEFTKRCSDVYAFPFKQGQVGVLFRDITEGKKAEEALRESEQLYHTLFDNSQDGFQLIKIMYNEAGTPSDFMFLKVNQAYENQTGLKESDVVGKTVKEALPGIEPSWISIYGNVAKTGKSISFENYNQGTQRWYDVHAFLFTKDKVGALFRDITQRKQAEDKLKQRTKELATERERFFNMLDNMPVMVCLITKDHKITFSNKLFKQVFGESEGRTCYDFVACLNAPCEFCESLKPLETGQPHHWVANFPNGKIVDAYDYPFVDVDGTLKILEVDVDITEHKKLEKELQERERFAIIGQTAGMVGHDIRNPLQAIIGDLFLLKSDVEDLQGESKRSALDGIGSIDENIGYIQKIVSDLQDLAKPLKPEPVMVSDLCKAIEQFLSTVKISDNIKAELKCNSIPALSMDLTFLKRIIVNLATNGIQAMPDGGKLTVRVYQKEEKVLIEVEDSGTGIPEEMKAKLFTPSLTTKSKGQGLGLPIIKRYTEALDGRISFESQEGKGTKFVLTLPIKRLQ